MTFKIVNLLSPEGLRNTFTGILNYLFVRLVELHPMLGIHNHGNIPRNDRKANEIIEEKLVSSWQERSQQEVSMSCL